MSVEDEDVTYCLRCERVVAVGDDCDEAVCDQTRFYDGGEIKITALHYLTDDELAEFVFENQILPQIIGDNLEMATIFTTVEPGAVGTILTCAQCGTTSVVMGELDPSVDAEGAICPRCVKAWTQKFS